MFVNVLSSVVDVCKLLLKMELWFLPGFFQSGCYLLMQGKLCKKIGWRLVRLFHFVYLCNMIDLKRLVLWSLLENDCFVLPGRGGFVVRNEKAFMDEGTGLFLPPRRTIGFNTSLTLTDGVLAQNIMQVCDTDYASAVRMLDEALADVDQKIQKEGRWSIPEVGDFCLSDTGTWQFEPASDEGIVAPAFWGLESIRPTLFTNLQVSEEQHVVSLSDEALPLSIENEEEWEDEEHESRTVRWGRPLRYVAVAAVVAIIVLFVSLPSAQAPSLSMAEGALFSFPVMPHRQVEAPSLSVPVNKQVVRSPQAAPPPAEVQKPIVNPQEEKIPSTCYTLVLASKVKESNAHDLVLRLSRKGFDKAVIYVKGKMTRVVYSAYSSEEEAIDSLRKLRATSDLFREAWVMECDSPLPKAEGAGQEGDS